jgi:hypothetical protein
MTVVIEAVERGVQGPQGDQGPSFTNWKGAWSGATAYIVGDGVSSGGSSYICILAHTNQTPPNATYWGVIASKGDTGATGPTGATGATGSVSSIVAADITDSTATGRSVLTGDAAAGRTALALGTAAVSATGDFAAASHNHAGSAITSGTVGAARLPVATSSEFRSGTADRVLGVVETAAAGAYVSLSDAATIAVDMSAGINFTVTLGGNRTLGAPTNTTEGRFGSILVYQDGTGGRTLSFNAVYKFIGGTAFSIDTTASRLSVLNYQVINSTTIFLTGGAGVR